MKNYNYLEKILRSNNTIFTIKDISLLWKEGRNTFHIKSRLSKYVSSGKLVRLQKGIYAKDKNYNRLELATKVYTPSYISFETVLTKHGVNFQFYKTIFVASYLSREITIDNNKIKLIKIKNQVLTDNTGIENINGVMTASLERAFLDRVYRNPDYHFDNLDTLNWEKIFNILPIYNNKEMNKRVNKYYKHYKNNI